MKLTNELRNVSLYAREDRGIEGLMRVRTFELSAGKQRFSVGRQEPVAVIVRDGGALKRISLAPPRTALPMAMIVAAPLVARAIVGLTRTNTMKRRS